MGVIKKTNSYKTMKEYEDVNFGGTLLPYIDIPHIQCLNEKLDGSCKKLFKPFKERLNFNLHYPCTSELGNKLLLKIPFTKIVRLRSFQVVCKEKNKVPSLVKLYRNQNNLDFESLEDTFFTQQFNLLWDKSAEIKYKVKVHQFNGVEHLTMFFNVRDQKQKGTEINYICLFGELLCSKSQSISTVYESSAKPLDHKIDRFKDNYYKNI